MGQQLNIIFIEVPPAAFFAEEISRGPWSGEQMEAARVEVGSPVYRQSHSEGKAMTAGLGLW